MALWANKGSVLGADLTGPQYVHLLMAGPGARACRKLTDERSPMMNYVSPELTPLESVCVVPVRHARGYQQQADVVAKQGNYLYLRFRGTQFPSTFYRFRLDGTGAEPDVRDWEISDKSSLHQIVGGRL